MSDQPAVLPRTAQTECKCCGSTAPFFAELDFNDHCARIESPTLLPKRGIKIAYYRCGRCELLFTNAFDRFSPVDFSKHIYNDQYKTIDGDFEQQRHLETVSFLSVAFRQLKQLRVLDYGAGNGGLAEFLKKEGFADVSTYDPYVTEHSRPPAGEFSLITCVEVIEHALQPRETFTEIASFLAASGVIIFTTLLQPPDIETQREKWWYMAPRNGHLCIHSKKSISAIAETLGLKFATFGASLHLLFRNLPSFEKAFLKR